MFRKAAYASIAALSLMSVAAPVFAAVPAAARWHRNYQVEFRMPQWQERSFTNRSDACRFEERKHSRGFEASLVGRGNRWEVRYRMPTWHTYRTCENDRQAQNFERILESRGYQARVVCN